MNKRSSRPAIEKRVRKAIQYLVEGDAEEALYAISPAIDVLAKQRFPTVKPVGERIKKLLGDEQWLIYYLSSQGKINLPEDASVVLIDWGSGTPIGNPKSHGGELADFVYHNIRCAQSHDAEIDYENIDIGREFGIARLVFENDGPPLDVDDKGKFVISKATILALILCIVCAPENKRLQLDSDFPMFNNVVLDKDELPGNKQYLLEYLEELFGEN